MSELREKIESLKFVLPKWQHSIIKYLIQTDNDYSTFVTYYNKEDLDRSIRGKNISEFRRVYDSMQKYRLDRINKMSITLDEFRDLYNQDPYTGLTTLFQQGVSNSIFELIVKKLTSGIHTLEKYYEYHLLNPDEFLQRIATSSLDDEFYEYLRSENDIKEHYKEEVDVSIGELKEYGGVSSSNQRISNVTIQRLVRDTKMALRIKIMYKGICQLCRNKYKSTNGFITEAHHIRPYNKIHKGDDSFLNLIVLCPNCHARFDDFYYAIHPKTLLVYCLDSSDDNHQKNIYMVSGHKFGEEYLKYAWNYFIRFKKSYYELTSMKMRN